MAGGETEGLSLQNTPTWIVALVCSVIVIISLFVERLLHYLGKVLAFLLYIYVCVCIIHHLFVFIDFIQSIKFSSTWVQFLKKKNQKPLFDALLKVKEELMLLGFISLLLVVFQGALQKICVSGDILKHMLPCKRNTETVSEHFVVGGRRSLLSSGGADSDYCVKKVQLNSFNHHIYFS